MVVDLAELPEDVALLQQLVRELVGALENEREQTTTLLRQLAALRRVQFGRNYADLMIMRSWDVGLPLGEAG